MGRFSARRLRESVANLNSLVEAPETVNRKDEAVDRVGEDVDDKPADELPLAFNEEDDSLEAVGLEGGASAWGRSAGGQANVPQPT